MTQPSQSSLSDELASAPNLAELNALIAKGRAYEFASRRTRNRWERIADQRREELESQQNGATL